MDILTTVGALVSIATLVALVGGGFYWWGRLSGRVDALEGDVKEVREEVKAVREEVKAVREDINAVREDVMAMRNEFLTELHRSEQRILTALAHHSHVSPEAGPPVFWQPIGMANPVTPPATEAPPATRNPGAETPTA